jgi:hypothetical protein
MNTMTEFRPWQRWPPCADGRVVQMPEATTRFTCPSCGQAAWAQPDAALMCVTCAEIMVAEEPEEAADLQSRTGNADR